MTFPQTEKAIKSHIRNLWAGDADLFFIDEQMPKGPKAKVKIEIAKSTNANTLSDRNRELGRVIAEIHYPTVKPDEDGTDGPLLDHLKTLCTGQVHDEAGNIIVFRSTGSGRVTPGGPSPISSTLAVKTTEFQYQKDFREDV